MLTFYFIYRYERELHSTAMVKAISVNVKCHLNDAHDTFVTSVYKKLEDSFKSVAMKNGVAGGIPLKKRMKLVKRPC
jgi:hypothetical protein